jgi:hypothetical protein
VSPAELAWIKGRPSILNNPKKLQEVSDAYYAARNSGMSEGRALALMAERFDVRDVETPVLGSEELIDVFARSKYAGNDRDQLKRDYNAGYHKMMAAKANGDYK